MKSDDLKKLWRKEEKAANIEGWDFSYINDRYTEEQDLPWDYREIIKEYMYDKEDILDYDTGGGEFLLSLNHPYDHTAATEGYPPNVELCRKRLLPLGIRFRECNNPSEIPFESESFDLIINRHGDYDVCEIFRLLRKGGVFITEQVGADNDRDLVEMVLPGTPKPFGFLTLDKQRQCFEKAGFRILQAEEARRPIFFYDIGAFVWFAHVIEWEFPGFSVDRCFEHLIAMQKILERNGKIEGTIHRFLLVAKK